MNQKTASASGQEEGEMTADPNEQKIIEMNKKSTQTVAFNTLLNTSQHGPRKESIQLQE